MRVFIVSNVTDVVASPELVKLLTLDRLDEVYYKFSFDTSTAFC